MREYNDYVQTTREYLKRYHEFKATIDNLNDEIQAQEELLKLDPSAPVPKYGDDTGGGKGELTPVESEASKRIEIKERIEGKRQEVARIERAMRKVDRALEALPDQERSLVEGYYFQHKSWMDLANELFVSEKWASKLANKVVKRMAGMGEFDAKAALLYMVNKCEETLHCDVCPAGCKDPSPEACKDRILDEAIREGVS